MTTKVILLINSEPTVREVVQTCLSHFGGWQVFSTGSPLEGLQCAVQVQPDAIVLDLSASSINYCTFLEKLRANPATQAVPVVLMAVGAKWLNSQQFQQLQVVGAIDYLPDPVTLAKQIARLLGWAETFQFAEIEDDRSRLN